MSARPPVGIVLSLQSISNLITEFPAKSESPLWKFIFKENTMEIGGCRLGSIWKYFCTKTSIRQIISSMMLKYGTSLPGNWSSNDELQGRFSHSYYEFFQNPHEEFATSLPWRCYGRKLAKDTALHFEWQHLQHYGL